MEFLKQNILELGKYFQTNCIEIINLHILQLLLDR